jgi:hypothetical protein
MYELRKLDSDLYQMHCSLPYETSMEGTLLAILTYSTHILGFNPDELELAVSDMIKYDLDGALFRIDKLFAYTFSLQSGRTG